MAGGSNAEVVACARCSAATSGRATNEQCTHDRIAVLPATHHPIAPEYEKI